MKKLNITILYGGRSGEHEVSLLSAASVYKHLDKDIYNINLIGIDKTGKWYYQKNPQLNDGGQLIINTQSPVSIVAGEGFRVKDKPILSDTVFPVLHGTFGEDGSIQGLLELMDLPYIGSGIAGSAVGMDKDLSKRIWEQAELPVVPFKTALKQQMKCPELKASLIQSIELEWGYPIFVKPANTGSSVGIRKVNEGELSQALDFAFQFDTKILIEPAIDAREIECAVIGNAAPRAFEPGEILTDESHGFYNYEAKYIDPNGAAMLIPADISPELRQTIQKMACKAFTLNETKGLARVDFFLNKDNGELLLNEINTIPGFTDRSMFASMCAYSGLVYSQMLNELILLAIERHKEKAAILYNV